MKRRSAIREETSHDDLAFRRHVCLWRWTCCAVSSKQCLRLGPLRCSIGPTGLSKAARGAPASSLGLQNDEIERGSPLHEVRLPTEHSDAVLWQCVSRVRGMDEHHG